MFLCPSSLECVAIIELDDMTYILYIVENKINGKKYVGITGRSIERRWSEHKSHAIKNINNGHFYRAIRKHGFDVFVIRELNKFEDKKSAALAEIEYIAANKPEYNSTLGGDGRLGGVLSEGAKIKLKLIHTGNSYRKGMTHTDETKQKLKNNGIKQIDLFRKYAHLGPKASSKKVLCLDDWMIFPSASAAARAYGVSKSAVIELCLGKRNRVKVGGFRFQYSEIA